MALYNLTLIMTGLFIAPLWQTVLTRNFSGAKIPELAQKLKRFSRSKDYDYRRQNVQVSNIGSNIFFLQKNNPPLLNSPVCNSRVQKTDPQFIVFNWSNVNTPSLPGNETEYTFSLFEIKPKNSNPNYIVKSSRPVFTTVTESNTFQYTPGEPALLDSMEYVWMVQARSKDGRDLYANQGYSIPCKFTYGGVDPFVVKYIGKPKVFAEPIHEKAAKVWWAPARETEKVELYRIEYRGSTNSIGEFPWHTEERKTDTTLTVYPLEPDREYDVRMRYKVSGVYGPYSEIIKFKTPPHKVVECGQPPNPLPLSTNTTPLPSASVGTIVRIGLFDVILTQVSGENGTFSGKGKIVTLGFGFGMALQFKDIFINTDKVVTRGEMYSEGDSMDTFIQKKLDKQHGGGDTGKPKTGDVIPEITTTLSILSIADVKVDTGKGTITIKEQQTGKEEVINYKEKNHKLPLTIEDKNGNLYNVDKNGKVSPAGKRGAAGSIPPLATLNTLNPELGKIIFGPGNNNKYAFDTWKDSYANAKELLTSRYENLNGYRVSAKAIAPGEQETITARLEKPANSNIDPTKIKFVSGKGITYPSTNQGNNFTITITGGPANDAQEVFAIVNNNGKDISIGKLLVASYAIAEKKLVLVPIGNLKSGLQEAITQGMKKAYAPITVNYTVEVDNSFSANKEWSKSGDGILQDSRSSFLSNNFTGEEKALLKVYKKTHTIDKDAVYLFVVNEAALRDGDLLGKMPRQSQFGFLFVKDASNENIGRTAAHEIGHGAYTLAHPFSAEVGLPQGTTNTLMDYGAGYDFLKFQWDIVHQPGNVWGVFEDDGESESTKKNAMKFDNDRMIEFLKTLRANNEKYINTTDPGTGAYLTKNIVTEQDLKDQKIIDFMSNLTIYKFFKPVDVIIDVFIAEIKSNKGSNWEKFIEEKADHIPYDKNPVLLAREMMVEVEPGMNFTLSMNGYSLSDKSITLYAHETSDKNGVKLTFFNGLIAKSRRPNEGDQKNIINIRKAFDITIHSKNAEAFKNYIKLKGTIRITEEKPDSEEIIIDVVRKRSNQYITVSELSIRGTNIKGAALELGKGTDAESKAECKEIRSDCYECKRIPAGEFPFEVNKSGRQGQHKYKTLRLRDTKVKGSQRDGILIHMGDALSWTQGCLLAMYDNEIEKIIKNDSKILPNIMGYEKVIDETNAGRAFILSMIEFIEEKENRFGKSLTKKVIIRDDQNEQTLNVNTNDFDLMQKVNRCYYDQHLYNKAVAQFKLFVIGLQKNAIQNKLQAKLGDYTSNLISTLTKENYNKSEVEDLYEKTWTDLYNKESETITLGSLQNEAIAEANANAFKRTLRTNFEAFIFEKEILAELFDGGLTTLFHINVIKSSKNKVIDDIKSSKIKIIDDIVFKKFTTTNYTKGIYDKTLADIKSEMIAAEIAKVEKTIEK